MKTFALALALASLTVALSGCASPVDALTDSANGTGGDAVAGSDLSTFRTAQSSYQAANGAFSTDVEELKKWGATVSPGTDAVSIVLTGAGYCVQGTSSGGTTLHLTDADANPAEGGC